MLLTQTGQAQPAAASMKALREDISVLLASLHCWERLLQVATEPALVLVGTGTLAEQLQIPSGFLEPPGLPQESDPLPPRPETLKAPCAPRSWFGPVVSVLLASG